MEQGEVYTVLEYMYRDAGNWKTCGSALLLGAKRGHEVAIRSCLDPGDLFVPEQVLLPGLHRRHWEHYGDGPSDLDHAFHEFVALRDAQEEEVLSLPHSGRLMQVVARFVEAQNRWDVRCSRYVITDNSGWIG